ncbi:hypothetical protein JCM11641_002206 [Rhodosporidiobolus odoratus]
MVNEQRPSLFQRATDYLNIFKAPPPRQVQPLEALLGVNKVLGFNDFLSRLPGLVSALDADRTEGRLRKGTTRPTNVVVILEKVAVELPKPSTTRKGKANCLQFLRVLSPDLKRNLTSKGYETESSSYGSRNQLCDVLVDQISIPTTASILLDDAQAIWLVLRGTVALLFLRQGFFHLFPLCSLVAGALLLALSRLPPSLRTFTSMDPYQDRLHPNSASRPGTSRQSSSANMRDRRNSQDSHRSSRPSSAGSIDVYPISSDVLAVLDASEVLNVQGFLKRVEEAAKKHKKGQSRALLLLKQATVSINPPKKENGASIIPVGFTVNHPVLEPPSNSRSDIPISDRVNKIILPEFSGFLSIDGVSAPLNAYTVNRDSAFSNLVMTLSGDGRNPLDLFCEELFVRPEWGRTSDGRFEVRLVYEVGAFKSVNAMCAIGDLALL